MEKYKNSSYKAFEIIVHGSDGEEKKLVERISFQEAVRDAYLMISTSCHSKKITSVRRVFD